MSNDINVLLTNERCETMYHDHPPTLSLADQSYQRDLGQRLRVRWSTPEDVDRLASFFANVMRSKEAAPPDQFHGDWVRDMMSGRHPHSSANDFALVEETSTATIVAATGLFANTVTYENIPFMLGRAAIVGTAIPYRQRGLQRAIFGLIHARSEARGHLAQGITGIHNFYRQFGYEYAIDLEAARHIDLSALPTKAALTSLRPAGEADIPALIELYARERACWKIATALDAQDWHWMLFAPDSATGPLRTAYMITTAEDVSIGYLLLDRRQVDSTRLFWGLAVKSGVPLAAVAPQALTGLRSFRETEGGAALDTRAAGDGTWTCALRRPWPLPGSPVPIPLRLVDAHSQRSCLHPAHCPRLGTTPSQLRFDQPDK